MLFAFFLGVDLKVIPEELRVVLKVIHRLGNRFCAAVCLFGYREMTDVLGYNDNVKSGKNTLSSGIDSQLLYDLSAARRPKRRCSAEPIQLEKDTKDCPRRREGAVTKKMTSRIQAQGTGRQQFKDYDSIIAYLSLES